MISRRVASRRVASRFVHSSPPRRYYYILCPDQRLVQRRQLQASPLLDYDFITIVIISAATITVIDVADKRLYPPSIITPLEAAYQGAVVVVAVVVAVVVVVVVDDPSVPSHLTTDLASSSMFIGIGSVVVGIVVIIIIIE